MRKPILITVIVLVGLLAGLGGLGFYLFNLDSVEALRQSINGEGSVSCTMVSTNQDSDETQQTSIYAKDGAVLFVGEGPEISHDLEASSPEETTTNYTLQKQEDLYIWSESSSQGITRRGEVDQQNSIYELAKNQDKFSEAIQGEEGSGQENDLSCRRWASKKHFEVPEGVDFITEQELYESLPQPESQPEIEDESAGNNEEAELGEPNTED